MDPDMAGSGEHARFPLPQTKHARMPWNGTNMLRTLLAGQYSWLDVHTTGGGLGRWGGAFCPQMPVKIRCQVSGSFTLAAPPTGPQIAVGGASWDLAPGHPIVEDTFRVERQGGSYASQVRIVLSAGESRGDPVLGLCEGCVHRPPPQVVASGPPRPGIQWNS